MKLLIISPSFFPAISYGGPIYSTFALAKTLKKQELDIKVLTTNANRKERLKVNTGVFNKLDNDLPVKYFNSLDSRGTSLALLLNLSKEIKNSDIIYLVSIFSPSTPFTVFLCKLYKKPLIITPRGQLGKWCLDQGNRFKKLWLGVLIHPFIKNLYWHLTSEAERRDILSVFPEAKTFVIPNGIDTRSLEISEQRKDNLFYQKYSVLVNKNSKIIISMGRLQKIKGFDLLINGFALLLNKYPDSFLFIAGENFGEKTKLHNLISSKDLSNRIFLVGYIAGEEKINFLKNADVFALPSYHENFGMVYGEALAGGTPIVASKNTPWQDIEKYNCGRWVENTSDKFAEAIEQILNLDCVQMGINGRKFIEENFSWDKVAGDFKKQIEVIIETNN